MQNKHAVEVKTNLVLRSRFKTKYKDINIDDFVRIFKKKQKYSDMKQHVKNWTDKTYKVVGIDRNGINTQVSYKLEGLNKSFLRHEILLVE